MSFLNDFVINIHCLIGIYRNCFMKTLALTRQYWWLVFTLYIYVGILMATAVLVGPLGMIGGFIYALVTDACLSSFLVMLETIQKKQKLSLDHFKKSFWVYFFDVIGVLFVYWIITMLILTPLAQAGHVWAVVAIRLTLLILFNPLPELIYIGGVSGMGLFSTNLFMKAYEFIRDNWIEWYVPNLIVMALLYFVLRLNVPIPFFDFIVFPFAIYFMMIFRGRLFEALYRSSRRSRVFQYRSGAMQ